MKYFTTVLFACTITVGLTVETLGQHRQKTNKFDVFIPSNFRIMDMSSADLNNDNFVDYVLVLQNMNETWDGNEARPLLIIMGSANNRLSLLARNDNIVLPKNGGGVFGDPYKAISLKNGYIAVEHSVGINWKWDRVIGFMYNPLIKEFVLQRDADINYHISDPNNHKDIQYNKQYYNQLLFCQYSPVKN